jgi:hypothetical protein
MESKSPKTLQIITGVIAVLYLAISANAFIQDWGSYLSLFDILELVLFIIFMVGFALTWTRKKLSGIIFMIWNAGVWIFALIFRLQHDNSDSAVIGIMAFPVMLIGALFLLEWYKTSEATVPNEQKQWKFILRILLINYAVLYGIVVLSELLFGKPVDYFSLPYIIFPLLLLIFLGGFVLSWKKEFLAGFIFLFWCAVYFGGFTYPEIFEAGPWAIFIFPMLFQAMFYIKNHYQYRPKKKFEY